MQRKKQRKKQGRQESARGMTTGNHIFFRLAFLTHITRQLIHTKGSDAHKMQDVSLALQLNVHVCIFDVVVITYLLQCCSSW